MRWMTCREMSASPPQEGRAGLSTRCHWRRCRVTWCRGTRGASRVWRGRCGGGRRGTCRQIGSGFIVKS